MRSTTKPDIKIEMHYPPKKNGSDVLMLGHYIHNGEQWNACERLNVFEFNDFKTSMAARVRIWKCLIERFNKNKNK